MSSHCIHLGNRQKALLLLLLCILVGVPANSQSAFDYISRNRSLSASNYCIYPDTIEPQMTPPPAGKKPFYISHYGRHGSRYLSNRKGYDVPYKMLYKADSLHQLTEVGKSVLREMRNIIDDSEGRWGDLTGLGKKQHYDIANRMMKRFPEVFADTAFIDARSTIVNRCILSMGSAVQKMVANNPRLKISINCTYRDMWYMNHQDKHLRNNMMPPVADSIYKAFSAPREQNHRLMNLLFVDEDYVKREIDEMWLNYYLLKSALIQQNTHLGTSSTILDLFSYEDIHQFWQKENAWWYINYGPSPLNGGNQPFTQRYLLRKIIEEADSCISKAEHGASLRFGHETIILPLTCLLGINGFDYQTTNLEELEQRGWWACLVFPMASNIQLVFYREGPDDPDVIFKVLLNENEATLPLPTDITPYYHWRDFREYYLHKLEAYEEMPSHTSASVSP